MSQESVLHRNAVPTKEEHTESGIILTCPDDRIHPVIEVIRERFQEDYGHHPFVLSFTGGAWGLVDRDRPDRKQLLLEELYTLLSVTPETIQEICLLLHADCGRLGLDGAEFNDREHDLHFTLGRAHRAGEVVKRELLGDIELIEPLQEQGLGDIRITTGTVDPKTGKAITSSDEVSRLVRS